jgi:hypothetical protein
VVLCRGMDLTFVTFGGSLFVLKNKETHWKKGKSKMSIDRSGLDAKLSGCKIAVAVSDDDSLGLRNDQL